MRKAEIWSDLNRWERSELARRLRGRGLSYGEIRRVIPVPKGTLSNWCSDVRLGSEQVRAIKARTTGLAGVPRDTQRKRRAAVAALESEAAIEALGLLNDPIWATGVAIYWGEGAKTQRALSVTNADPALLRRFIVWVRRYHDEGARFVLSLHLHEGNSEEEAKEFWRESLGLPDADFHKTYIKASGTGHRKNSLPHGVCRVLMRRSADASIRTMTWIRVLAEGLPQ
ncbi:MAG: hypothetical protein OES13_04035 [Acidimicrobiia bacterium]|nr:hypothetical protein [Acidimicrobiia bacterium]